MYSGPLSQRITFGLPRQSMICSSDRITRVAGKDRSTSMPQAFAVELVKHVEQPEAGAIAGLVVHEVHRPDLIDRLSTASGAGFSRTRRSFG